MLDPNVLPHGIATFTQTLMEPLEIGYRCLAEEPITGIASCAIAANGDTIAPPTSLMNSRRLITPSPHEGG